MTNLPKNAEHGKLGPGQKAIRPRNAASLVIVDFSGKEPHVLMGKRRSKASFIPDAYVFPGGGVEKADEDIHPANPLDPAIISHLGGTFGTGKKPNVLPNTAIRETFEETGLVVGTSGNGLKSNHPSWQEYAQLGFVPDHSQIGYVGRAITPTASPIRFHARFFITSTDHISGKLAGSGELLHLDFFPLSRAFELPIIDVTEFMLTQVRQMVASDQSFTNPSPKPLFSYRNQRPYIRFRGTR